jgi:hypothetical protein
MKSKKSDKRPMAERELDAVLKKARVPDRSPAYWKSLPKRVLQRLSSKSCRPKH